MPNAHNSPDVAYLITLVYQQLGRPETRKNYGILYGECDEIEGATIIKVETEYGLFAELARLMRELDPEVIIGYNILGFDYPYLNTRLKRRIKDWPVMGRMEGRIATMYSKEWKSSAYSYNHINILEMDGRISVDLLPLIKRANKLDKYDLDTVSQKFIGRGKHDVKPSEMFEIYQRLMEAKEDMKQEFLEPEDGMSIFRYWQAVVDETRVVKYGLQDSILVIDLFEKLLVWIELVELSSIVGVTMVELFTRGQQIRCVSQVYHAASQRGFVLDSRMFDWRKFSGGNVEEPVKGMHENVICLDFRSLYPSIIEAYNICFTTLVWEGWEDIIPDEQCNIIESENSAHNEEEVKGDTPPGRDQEDKDEKDTGGALEGEEPDYSSGEEDERAEYLPGRKQEATMVNPGKYKFIKKEHHLGILPQIAHDLVAARRQVRDEIAQELKKEGGGSKLLVAILDKRQNGLKVSANSLFGFLGAKGGKLPLPHAAMSITGLGKKLILTVKQKLIENYNARIIYGDSVAEDTPLLLRYQGYVFYKRIGDLVNFTSDHNRPDGKQECIPEIEIEVWSDVGWTRIKRVIRHKTDKEMYRVLTHTGVVDVTEDHSLLRPDGAEVTSKEIRIGEDLLHYPLPKSDCLPFQSREVIIEGKMAAAEMFYRMTYNGNNVSIVSVDKEQYHLQITSSTIDSPFTIQEIIPLGRCDGYVYDLETENHHFAAGVGQMVVHNTDSLMIDLNIKDSKECHRRGKELSDEISGTADKPGWFPPPLGMEYEKAGRFLCLKRKKYVVAMVDKNGNHLLAEKDLGIKGIVLARRDNCKWLKKTYMAVLMRMMQLRPIEEAFDVIIDAIRDLFVGNVSWKDLIMIRELGSHYKSPSYFMKVFSDELLALGKPAQPGDRLEHLYVIPNQQREGKILLGQTMRLPETYLERLGTTQEEKLDHQYYLEHVLMNPIDQLFSTRYAKELETFEEIGYKPAGRRQFVGIKNPVKMIQRLVQDGKDPTIAKYWIRRTTPPIPRPPRPRLRIMPAEEKIEKKLEEIQEIQTITPPTKQKITLRVVNQYKVTLQ
jgi:DNA polymerase elongation subunit (family B)